MNMELNEGLELEARHVAKFSEESDVYRVIVTFGHPRTGLVKEYYVWFDQSYLEYYYDEKKEKLDDVTLRNAGVNLATDQYRENNNTVPEDAGIDCSGGKTCLTVENPSGYIPKSQREARLE